MWMMWMMKGGQVTTFFFYWPGCVERLTFLYCGKVGFRPEGAGK
jgi:hypothetical protein